VTKVREEVTKLNKILSDFLKFARATPLALSEIDIRGVISDSLLFTKAEVEKRNVECQVDLPDGDLKVMIDPEQIQQVFTNIILNGAQAIGDDGRIAISALKDGDEYISVSFSDNGPGIRPDDLQRIFDPFFTTKDTGTGLGLSMSHKIVETHGGSIEVSTEDSGTTFKIRLPTMTAFRKRRKHHETRAYRG
jgi:signal transduction histidine kinase